MSDWTVIEKKDQERIWDIAMALMSRSEISLAEALQRGCTEFYGVEHAMRRGIKFYALENGEQTLRRLRELENGTWVSERARVSGVSTIPPKEG